MAATGLISATLTALPAVCMTTMLPAGAVISLANGIGPFTLDQPAVYQMPCPVALARRDTSSVESSDDSSSLNSNDNANTSPKVSNFRDPFYASTFPICFALAACTIMSYLLVIMLLVTPRSFLDGGVRYLSRRSFTNSSAGGISIGGRPWLQKVAALTVAISLTVASASTFKIAEFQYSWGAQNAGALQKDVLGGTDLKVIRVISDTFLWLAQAQTLIRLFPRQREKIIIKWLAFALITLDVVFSAINSFSYARQNGVSGSGNHAGTFVHVIPTFSYLIQLSLELLYAAWVIYYALMKRRYAFYHPLMKNICLVAMISLVSITAPVVFFILDISRPEFAAWGDYVRWVGAAASSVVVWEWVERIEALERETKKDGILGREVFREDDMLEVNASEPPLLRRRKTQRGSDNGRDSGGLGNGRVAGDHLQESPTGYGWPGAAVTANRYGTAASGDIEAHRAAQSDILRPPIWPARPSPARTTPVSRTNTPSASSTVYAVRYQPGSETTARTPELPHHHSLPDLTWQNSIPRGQSEDTAWSNQMPAPVLQNGPTATTPPTARGSGDLDSNRPPTSQPSRRMVTQGAGSSTQRGSDEASIDTQRAHLEVSAGSAGRSREDFGRWDLRAKLEMFAANQADKIRERLRPTQDTDSLPVQIIPAPPRRGAALQRVLEEEELIASGGGPLPHAINDSSRGPSDSSASASRDTSSEMRQLQGSRSVVRGLPRAGRDEQTNPPLWPGVQRRQFYDDDEEEEEEYSYDGEESLMDETASSVMDPSQRGSDEDRPGVSRAAP